MNSKLNLLKIAPLVIVSMGLIISGQIATAATGETPVEQKLIETPKHEAKSHSNDSHGLDEHQPTKTKETTTSTEHHKSDGGHDTTTQGEAHGISGLPNILLSPQAQRIEFFSFLSVLGLGILAPELFYRPRRKNQNIIHLETAPKSPELEVSTAQRQPNFSRGNVTFAQFSDKPDGNNQTEGESAQSTTEERPTFTVITDISQPRTIPNRQTDSFTTGSKSKLDNWSQPKRDIA